MDMSYCYPLQLEEEACSFLFNCDVLQEKSRNPLSCDLSDSGYFSSLSPASSTDSSSFSPNTLQVKAEPQDCFIFRGAAQQAATSIRILPQPASTASAPKKSRSKYPGKKRQTASEREKLRMRDLTKALQHLRGFLPVSVAPEGQALTKIEILRLTIRYISHLSALLGSSEENLEHRRSTGHMDQAAAMIPVQETQSSPGAYPGAYTNPLMTSSGLCYSQCWVPQQQLHHMGFNGHC